MEYIQGPGEFYIWEDTAVTLGKFDGLHRGHQKLIRRILELERQGCKSVVFTLSSGEKGQLLSASERKQRVEQMGVSYFIDYPLVPEILRMEPEEFVSEILVKRLQVRYIIVGEDYRFGYQRKGNYRLLMELQKTYGFCVEVIKKEQYHGKDISSTYIKEVLKTGNMDLANELLGYSL